MSASEMLFLSFGEHDGTERTLYCSKEEFWAVIVREKLGQDLLLWGPDGKRKSSRRHVLIYDIFRRSVPLAQVAATNLKDAELIVEKHLNRLDAIYRQFEKVAPGRWDACGKTYDERTDDYTVDLG